jgi:hypothetical protein
MNVFMVSESSPHYGMRQMVFNFWRCIKLFLIVFLLFVPGIKSTPSVESQIIADVRRVETEIAHVFGYAKWPFAPTKVEYAANCRGRASFSYGGTIVLSCDTVQHKQGKVFLEKSVSGKTEVFPGYADYLDTVAHEIAHIFSRLFIDLKDPYWKECDTDEYFELSEGFATYAAYEILLRESAAKHDPEYERYLAAKTARYLAQLDVIDQQPTHSSLSNFPIASAFSPESTLHIDSELGNFLAKKILALKDEDSVNDWYPRGLMRVYALRHIFTQDGFEKGTIKKYFCR